MSADLLFSCVLLGLVVVGGALAWRSDRRVWNGGRHYTCGGAWERFDRRGYRCAGCGRYVWISWPVDRSKP